MSAAAVAASPYAPPQSALDASPAEAEPATPSRINPLLASGIILLLNAVLGILETVLSHGKSGGSSPIAFIIDGVVGVGLIQNKPDYRKWAIVRAVLGFVVYSGLSVARGEMSVVFFAAIYVGAQLMLLIGQPSKARIWGGIALAAVFIVLEMVGLAMMASGSPQ